MTTHIEQWISTFVRIPSKLGVTDTSNRTHPPLPFHSRRVLYCTVHINMTTFPTNATVFRLDKNKATYERATTRKKVVMEFTLHTQTVLPPSSLGSIMLKLYYLIPLCNMIIPPPAKKSNLTWLVMGPDGNLISFTFLHKDNYEKGPGVRSITSFIQNNLTIIVLTAE